MRIRPTKGQRAFLKCNRRIKGLFGGRGSGKTTAGVWQAILTIQDPEREGQNGMIIAPDYPHLIRSTWPEVIKWLPPEWIADRNKSEKWLLIKPRPDAEPSRIYYGGIDDPDSWRGPNTNWLFFDECGKKKTDEAWLILIAGVRIGPEPKAWVTTTPKGKSHWLYDVFVQNADPLIHWHGFASVHENAHNLDPLFIQTLESSYTGAWKRQELHGEFVELEGTIFQRHWFNLVDFAPDTRYVRFWDLAASVRTAADYSVGAKVGFHEGKLYLTDLIRGRWEWPDARKVIIQTAQTDGPSVHIGIEKTAFQLAAVQDLRREEALLGHIIRGIAPDKDKLARAMPWASRAQQGLVNLVDGSYVKAFLDEVCDFPQGSHDDQVDAVSGAVEMLTKKVDPRIRSI